MSEVRLYPKIFHADTAGKFLKLYDRLDVNPKFRKVSLEIFQYEPKPNTAVRHNIDVDDFLYLCFLLKSGRLGIRTSNDSVPAGTLASFEEYKGSPSKNYSTGYEARILRITRHAAKRAEDMTVYAFQITNGPGEQTSGGTGAVKLAKGGDEKKLSFFLPEREAIKLALSAEQYIAAFMSSHFGAIQEAHHAWDQKRDATETKSAPESDVNY